jgi:hypothetical protein
MEHEPDNDEYHPSAYEPIIINRVDAEAILDALEERGTEAMLREAYEMMARALEGLPRPAPTEFVPVPVEDFGAIHEALRKRNTPFTHDDVADIVRASVDAWQRIDRIRRVTGAAVPSDQPKPSQEGQVS